jgi:hypothetical protein
MKIGIRMDPAKWQRAVALSYLRSERSNKCRYCPGNATYRLASLRGTTVMYACGYCVKQLPAELRPLNEGEPTDGECDQCGRHMTVLTHCSEASLCGLCRDGFATEEPDTDEPISEHDHLMWANRGADWLRGNKP